MKFTIHDLEFSSDECRHRTPEMRSCQLRSTQIITPFLIHRISRCVRNNMLTWRCVCGTMFNPGRNALGARIFDNSGDHFRCRSTGMERFAVCAENGTILAINRMDTTLTPSQNRSIMERLLTRSGILRQALERRLPSK